MKRDSTRRLQAGFTLAEVLVATAVFAIIMIAALAVYDQSNRVFKKGSEAAELQQSTRIGFDKLISDLRMAGFDYNRGGTPNIQGEYPQPDEQIEYAGPNVIAFRANFNYNTGAQGCDGTKVDPCDNGLEMAYTPSGSPPPFPYVTTSNDEIVIYALKSTDPNKNTQSISFWADTSKPRGAYPGSPQSGQEQMVTVNGIDTTGANPPYTLYRFRVSEATDGCCTIPSTAGTPVAENIRTLRFFYYTDQNGRSLVTKSDGTAITNVTNADGSTYSANVTLDDGTSVPTGSVGGAGKYVINADGSLDTSDAHYGDRSIRSTIVSVRADYVGMNPTPDGAYTNPTETNASLKNYREYHLSALVTPRNLGLTGFPEQNYSAPGPPTITGICTGHCAAPVICWSPPATGGTPTKYTIQFGTSQATITTNQIDVTDPTLTSFTIPDQFGIDPSQSYIYQMIAVNDNGPSQPSATYAATPINTTKPGPPTQLQGTVSTAQQPVGPNNAITLTWTSAKNNDASLNSLTCSGTCTGSATAIPPEETIKFRIYRGTDPNFQLANGVVVLDNTMPQTAVPPNSTGTFVDSATTSQYAPGNCVQYYYRIMEMDRCINNANWNNPTGTATATSTEFPLQSGATNATGEAYDGGIMASAPLSLTVDTTKSACPAPSSKNCSITLNWPQIATDVKGNRIGVDRYLITRLRKTSDDTDYSIDSTFGTCGQTNVSGFSSNNSGTATWTDTSGPATNSVNGDPWYYEYIVQANDCRISWPCGGGGNQTATSYKDPYNGASCNAYQGDTSCLPKAQYPNLCGSSPAIVESGASQGDGSLPNPWVFNANDTIQVTDTDKVLTFKSVEFDLLRYPDGAPILTYNTPSNALNPATFTWPADGSLTFGQLYYVRIIIVYNSGCTETHIRYAQEFQPAGCSFTNQALPPQPNAGSGNANCGTKGTNGQQMCFTTIAQGQQFVTDTFVVTNTPTSGADAMRLTGLSIAFGSTSQYADLVLDKITYLINSNSYSTSALNSGFPNGGPYNFSGNIPLPSILATGGQGTDIASGKSVTIVVEWHYKNNDDTVKAASLPDPLQKLCLSYQLYTINSGCTDKTKNGVYGLDCNDSTVKNCNVVGQAASTKNPTSCD